MRAAANSALALSASSSADVRAPTGRLMSARLVFLSASATTCCCFFNRSAHWANLNLLFTRASSSTSTEILASLTTRAASSPTSSWALTRFAAQSADQAGSPYDESTALIASRLPVSIRIASRCAWVLNSFPKRSASSLKNSTSASMSSVWGKLSSAFSKEPLFRTPSSINVRT